MACSWCGVIIVRGNHILQVLVNIHAPLFGDHSDRSDLIDPKEAVTLIDVDLIIDKCFDAL